LAEHEHEHGTHHEHHGQGSRWSGENTIALSVIIAGLLLSLTLLVAADAINRNISALNEKSVLLASQVAMLRITAPAAAGAEEQAPQPTVAPTAEVREPEAPTIVSPSALKISGRPAKGATNPQITIVEFSDFECPFCSRTQPTLKQLMQDYPNKIKLVFKHFPLPFHANAQKAAEAAECANAQGKFWEMHDKLFENQQALAVTDLKKYAADLKLDTAKFNKCLDDGEKASVVKADAATGESVGVGGTPSFFVNGEMLVGAQPVANFKAIIDKLLAG